VVLAGVGVDGDVGVRERRDHEPSGMRSPRDRDPEAPSNVIYVDTVPDRQGLEAHRSVSETIRR
jgi:hypothetical protein